MFRYIAIVAVLALAFASQASAAAINISNLRAIDGSYCVDGSCTQTFATSTDASGSISIFDFDMIITASTMHEFSALQTSSLNAFGASGVMSATASTGVSPPLASTAGSIGVSLLSFSFEVLTPHGFNFDATLSGVSSTTHHNTKAESLLFYCDPVTSICDTVFSFSDSGADATPFSVFSTMGVLLPGLGYHFVTRATASADAGPGFPFPNLTAATASADFTFTLTEEIASVPEPSTLLLFGLGVVTATRRHWLSNETVAAARATLLREELGTTGEQ